MRRSVIWVALLTVVSVENAAVSNKQIETANNCKCVKHFQCDNGNIITNGSGIVTVGKRTSAPILCNSQGGLTGETVCCKLDQIKVNPRSVNDLKFPWLAAVFNKMKGQSTYEFKCGGSLVHPKAILTASHCLDDLTAQDLVVVVTGRDRLSLEGATEKERRYVSQIIRHPRYAKDTLYNDAALLILKEEFRIDGSSKIKTLTLPESDIPDLGPYECYVAGWGEDMRGYKSSAMKKQLLPFVDHTRCQELLRKTAVGEYFILDESFMCAGGVKDEDACTGDGGGPLACRAKNTFSYFQAGIVSWGMGCGEKDVPGVYVDVQKITEWVQNEIDNNL